MIDKTVLDDILIEAFQDFDLLDYKHILSSELKICETDNGTLKLGYYFDDYKHFYKRRAFKKIKVTYKYVLILDFRFYDIEFFNKEEFDDFFEDGMTKLNYLLEKYNIEIPNIGYSYDISMGCFWYRYTKYGDELQLPTK
jgi:hypothetical protein